MIIAFGSRKLILAVYYKSADGICIFIALHFSDFGLAEPHDVVRRPFLIRLH